MTIPPPTSAYVHVPFCRHRCGYCNFTVIAGRDDLIADFLKAIEIELSWLEYPRPVDTLFVGGGTPTHLPEDAFSRFFEVVRYWFPPKPNAEISMEANPEDMNPAMIQAMQAAKVTRASLGVQSFRQKKLETLERSHDANMVIDGIHMLREIVTSLSLDLIFAAPHETLREWKSDLRQATALSVDHISTYGLTYEQGTSFIGRRDRGELVSAGENLEREMYELAIDELQVAGFEHYEVSNFARPGHRCRHNENYWFCQPFYGVGPGAARFVGGTRETNVRSTTQYLKKVLQGESPTAESERLEAEELAREQLVFGLRRLDGVNMGEFERATGYSIPKLAPDAFSMLVDQGFLECTDSFLRLTRKGLLVSDAIWPYLL